MIVKIKSHKRAVFANVLKYMVNNKDRLIDSRGKSFTLTHNLKGRTLEKWVEQYRGNEALRLINRKDSVRLTHEILSWHKDDAKNMTFEKMEAVARAYIQQRNPKGMYVAVPHFDKDHYHVHICASGLEYKTGKSLRMSRDEFSKLKKDIQQFQVEKFPELSRSTVQHGKGDRAAMSDAEYQIKRRTGRETNREVVMGMLKTCYKKADSKETFFQLMKESGIKTYERSGKVTGVVQDGIKFRFSRLGFTEERLADLERTKARGRELREVRKTEEPEIERRIVPEPEGEKDDDIKEDMKTETAEETPEEESKEQDDQSRDDELDEIRSRDDDSPDQDLEPGDD